MLCVFRYAGPSGDVCQWGGSGECQPVRAIKLCWSCVYWQLCHVLQAAIPLPPAASAQWLHRVFWYEVSGFTAFNPSGLPICWLSLCLFSFSWLFEQLSQLQSSKLLVLWLHSATVYDRCLHHPGEDSSSSGGWLKKLKMQFANVFHLKCQKTFCFGVLTNINQKKYQKSGKLAKNTKLCFKKQLAYN